MPKINRLSEPEHVAVQKLIDQLLIIINGRVPAKTIDQLNKLSRWDFDDDDDDSDPAKLAAKFKIDEPTYRKLVQFKGDETLDILKLAARKGNPKGYVLTCIRNAENAPAWREREREAQRQKADDLYEQQERARKVREQLGIKL